MSAAVIVGEVENLKNIPIALFSTGSLHFSLSQLSQVMSPQHGLPEKLRAEQPPGPPGFHLPCIHKGWECWAQCPRMCMFHSHLQLWRSRITACCTLSAQHCHVSWCGVLNVREGREQELYVERKILCSNEKEHTTFRFPLTLLKCWLRFSCIVKQLST